MKFNFRGLEPLDIQHPEDRATVKALQKIPGITAITNKISEYAVERTARLEMIASAVQITSSQYAGLHDILVECCATLDMPEPELYISNSPEVNAYSRGVDSPLIVLNSGLIDIMTENEIRFVIAHELGHIKCDHVRYSTMLDLLYNAGSLSAVFSKFLAQPVALALERWARRSELTADRSGFLGCQDRSVALSTLMKLAGGTILERFGTLDAAQFLEQSDRYHRLTEKGLNKFYSWKVNTESDHPQPVSRAREIFNWAESEQYLELRSRKGILQA